MASCLFQGSLLDDEFHGASIIFVYGLFSVKHNFSVWRLVMNIGQCAYDKSFAWPGALILFFNLSLIIWKSPFNSHYNLIHLFLKFILEYWFSNIGLIKIWKYSLKSSFYSEMLAKLPTHVNILLFASGGRFGAGFFPCSKADQSQCQGLAEPFPPPRAGPGSTQREGGMRQHGQGAGMGEHDWQE